MRLKRKHKFFLQKIGALLLLAVLLLALFIWGLIVFARHLGLEPQAFVVAAFAGLGTLILYSIGFAIFYIVNRRIQAGKQLRALKIADVDRMEGPDFEQYVAQVMIVQGYEVSHTGRSGDMGVDLIAQRDKFKFAVQVKRYSDPVSRRAVSDAVGGMAEYDCNAAMVVTNQYFTQDAIALAKVNHCLLIDRDKLAAWIVDFQETQ